MFGGTCCEPRKSEWVPWPMTFAEAGRIAERVCKPITEAVDLKHGDAKELERASGKSLARLIVRDRGLYLPRNEDGSCCYLVNKSCSIESAKPAICAMFPLRRIGKQWKRWRFVSPGFCLVQDTVDDVREIAAETGRTLDELDTIANQWDIDRKRHYSDMESATWLR